MRSPLIAKYAEKSCYHTLCFGLVWKMGGKTGNKTDGLNAVESRTALSLAAIFALRMMGLFLILPVFSLYAQELEGVTPMLVGLAIGAYGLSQALFQIPLGMLSDRIGRKPVIVAGLLIFALGSVVAAVSEGIWGIILGRVLQGSGAIAAAVMALAADLTRESHRTRVMGVIGISIGFAFMLSLVLGPMINSVIGVPGIFWLTSLLALVGIALILLFTPTPAESRFHSETEPSPGFLKKVLKERDLVRLDVGIFILHMTLTALFLAFPLILQDGVGLTASQHGLFYLPVVFFSMLLMAPLIVVAERKNKLKPFIIAAIVLMAGAQFGLFLLPHALWVVAILLLAFFTAFNLLEAMLPSLISRLAPAAGKGAAMGVYSTSQFAGAFVGGVVGGWVQQHYGIEAVFLFGALAAVLWLSFTFGMKQPSCLVDRLIRVGKMDSAQAAVLQAQLVAIEGVCEAVVVPEDGVAYLKVSKEQTDWTQLDAFLRADE